MNITSYAVNEINEWQTKFCQILFQIVFECFECSVSSMIDCFFVGAIKIQFFNCLFVERNSLSERNLDGQINFFGKFISL